MSTTLDSGPRPRMDPRIARRRVEVRREEGRRRLRILVACSCAFAVLCLLVGSLWTPLFKVRHVHVTITPLGAPGAASPGPQAGASGTAQVNVQQVLVAAGLAKQRLMIDVNAASTERRLDSVPVIGAAHVSVDWPGTVKISVVVRRAVAQVALPAQFGSAPRWATVDATGRVLTVSPTALPGLPVLYGVTGVPGPGAWIPGSGGPSIPVRAGDGTAGGYVDMNARSDSTDVPTGVAAVLAIAASIPAGLQGDVQSITAGTGAQASLSMAVLPKKVAAGSIKVVLGDGSQLDAKLTALATLLTQANLSGVAQIDLTVPDRPAALAQQH